jgi:hypothetical protein
MRLPVSHIQVQPEEISSKRQTTPRPSEPTVAIHWQPCDLFHLLNGFSESGTEGAM